jgi:hypothetical protein
MYLAITTSVVVVLASKETSKVVKGRVRGEGGGRGDIRLVVSQKEGRRKHHISGFQLQYKYSPVSCSQ